MSIHGKIKSRIEKLKKRYSSLLDERVSLLKIIKEVEISESVFNSNAIENSTLTLDETEHILLEMEVARDLSLREVFEAKNLARVVSYLDAKKEVLINREILLFMHNMLLHNIDEQYAGRYMSGNASGHQLVFWLLNGHHAPLVNATLGPGSNRTGSSSSSR